MFIQSIKRLLTMVVILTSFGCGSNHLMLGRNALGMGEYKDAIEHLEIALREQNQHPNLRKELASAYRSRAAYLMINGSCERAWTYIQRADELSLDAVLLDHQQVYDCMVKQNVDVQLKRRVIEHLMILGDTRPEVLHVLMNLLLDASEWKEAVRHSPTLERRYSLRIEDRRRLALAYFNLGKLSEARHHLTYVVARKNDDALSRLKLAEACEGLGLEQEAKTLYVRAARDFKNNPVVFLRLARFLAARGDTNGAAEANRRANTIRGIQIQKRNLRPLLRSRR